MVKKKEDEKINNFNFDEELEKISYPNYYKRSFKKYLIDNNYIDKIKDVKDLNNFLDKYGKLSIQGD